MIYAYIKTGLNIVYQQAPVAQTYYHIQYIKTRKDMFHRPFITLTKIKIRKKENTYQNRKKNEHLSLIN